MHLSENRELRNKERLLPATNIFIHTYFNSLVFHFLIKLFNNYDLINNNKKNKEKIYEGNTL